jgi:two-component system chemotaxis response regulator CheB
VLRSLPADFPVPVLALQHITSGFLDGLITWLDQAVPLPVRIARDGDRIAPGVWFAPDDAHLVLDQGRRLRFDRQTVAGWHRPSADVLFTSLAASVGRGAVAVVLTGMGNDGEDGVAALRAGHGFTIAQDERTSAIYGMPRAAAEQGVDLILPLEQIGPTLASIARTAAV